MSGITIDINPDVLNNEQMFRLWLIQTLTNMQSDVNSLKEDTSELKGVQRDQETRVKSVERVSWKTAAVCVGLTVAIETSFTLWKLWH